MEERKEDKIMKHEYEDIVSMLTLPETIAQSLLLLPGVTSPRQQYRDCAIVSGSVSMLAMSSYSCFIFHPYLVSFPFYAIPICPPFRNP